MRWKKEIRGKPLDPEKGIQVLNKLFQGMLGKDIAREVGVSNSTVSKIKSQLPLFFGLSTRDD